MKRALAIVGVLVVAAGAGWWIFAHGDRGTAGRGDEVGDGSASVAAPPEAPPPGLKGSASAARQEEPPRRATIEGLVQRDGVASAARIELRSRFRKRLGSLDSFSAESLAASVDGPLPPPPPLAVANAGANGKFAVTLEVSGWVEALAIASDGASGYAFADIPANGARVGMVIDVLSGSYPLAGRLVLADGRPWMGKVTACADDLSSQFLHGPVVTTDADGRFAIGGLPAGTATVTAWRSGETRFTRRGVPVPHPGEYVLVVDAGLSTLSGRVVDEADGKPVAGATLWMWTGASGNDSLGVRAVSGPDGAFSIPRAGPRDYLRVSADGYAGLTCYGRDIDSPFEVRLAKAATAWGAVVRERDGTPVPFARVQVISLAPGTSGIALTETTADDRGEYEIRGLPPGDVAMVGSAPGLRSSSPTSMLRRDYGENVVTLSSGVRTRKDVRLVAAAAIEGVVVEEGGGPVAAAIVEVAKIGDTDARFAPADGKPAAVATDVNGAFRIDGLPAGTTCSLSAAARGYLPATSAPVTLPEAAIAEGAPTSVTIRLAPGLSLAVEVGDAATGAPIAGVALRLLANRATSVADGVTDEAGRASLRGFAAGTYQVEARSAGRGTVRQDVTVPTSDVLAIAMAKGRILSGRVIGPDGAPLAGANVSVWASEVGTSIAATQSAADGTFRVVDLPEGEFRVDAFAWTGTPLSGSERGTPGREVSIRATERDPSLRSPGFVPAPPATPPKGTLTARLLDPSGRAVPRATVRLTWWNGYNGALVTAGRAVFTRPSDDDAVTVEAWGARNAYGAPLPLGPAKVPVPAGVDEVEVRLPPELAVTGTVVTPDGKPAYGVLVIAAWPSDESSAQRSPASFDAVGSGRSDEAGRFRVGGLSQEEVVLVASPPPGGGPVPGVRARGGATGVVIRLRPGATPRLTVVDANGKPVVGARPSLVPLEGGAAPISDATMESRSTGEDGQVVLWTIDPTVPYRLQVRAPGRQDLASFEVARWMPRDETLRMPRACLVRGVLVDTTGRPVAQATVRIVPWRYGDTAAWARTDAEGRFELTRVAEGTLTLEAKVQSTPSRAETTVTAAPSMPDVTLTIDLGLDWRVTFEGWPARTNALFVRAAAYDGAPAKDVPYSGADVTGGAAVFHGIRRDATYTVWAHDGANGVYALESGLRYSEEGATVAAKKGISISGRLLLPKGATDVRVWATRPGLMAWGLASNDGVYEVRGLPPGEWTIGGMCSVPNSGVWRAETTAAAGTTVDVPFRRPERPQASDRTK